MPNHATAARGRTAALLVIDVQNDYMPGGAVPVPDGEAVIPVLNRYIRRFSRQHFPVYASRDWHPAKTRHFERWGGAWPAHCVQDSPGAAFHPALRLPLDAVVVSKGGEPDEHGESAFDGFVSRGRPLATSLERRSIGRLFVGGVPVEHSVYASVTDALAYGFDVVLLRDAVQGVAEKPLDASRAVTEMVRAGAREVTHASIHAELPSIDDVMRDGGRRRR